MQFVYFNKELKHYHLDVSNCYNWIMDNQSFPWDQAKKYGWLIFDKPFGTLEEFLGARKELLQQHENKKVKKMTKTEYVYFKNYLSRKDIEYVKEFKLFLPIEEIIVQ